MDSSENDTGDKNLQTNVLLGVQSQENQSKGQWVHYWSGYSFVKKHNGLLTLQNIFRKVV